MKLGPDVAAAGSARRRKDLDGAIVLHDGPVD